MLAPDTVLQNRYRIVRSIGQGGMGSVYMATDQRLRSTVALKETLFTDERLRRAFEHEAELLASLHHPALPSVSDHFVEADGQFLVMQFVAGDDLSEMLKRHGGPFPPEEVLGWADQLLDALDYLHTQDPPIIHRDIKPQNLKITSRGHVVLLDFGLAKGTPLQISRVTASGSIFGYTPNYAPLEQIHGTGTDHRSDLYSLAATIYHLMTGVTPPDALSRASAMVSEQPDPLQPANEINARVSQPIAAVLSRAMAQNKNQRYASAVDMRRALQSAETGPLPANTSEARTVLLAGEGTVGSINAGIAGTEALGSAKPTVPASENATEILPGRGSSASGRTPLKLETEHETEVATQVQKAAGRPVRGFKPWYAAVPILVLAITCFGIYKLVERRPGSSIAPAVQTTEPAAATGTTDHQPLPAPSGEAEQEPADQPLDNSIATDEPETSEQPAKSNSQRAQKTKKAAARPDLEPNPLPADGMDPETQREIEKAMREAEAARRNAERYPRDARKPRELHVPVSPPEPAYDNYGNPNPGPKNWRKPQTSTQKNSDGSTTTTVIQPNGRVLRYTMNPNGTLRGKPQITTQP